MHQPFSHPAIVTSVCFSPDGAVLASGLQDGALWLWDVSTGASVRKLEGGTSSVISMGFSPDGKTLATAYDRDTLIRLWDLVSKDC
jgi:WD40 repeat protein